MRTSKLLDGAGAVRGRVAGLAAPTTAGFTVGVGVGVRDRDPVSGPAALRSAQLKYTAFAVAALGDATPVLPRAPATVSSTVAANPDAYDASYISNATAGSPPSTYRVILDTGSSEVQLYAPKLGTSGTVTTTVTVGAVAVQKQPVALGGASGQFGPNSDADGEVGLAPAAKSFYVNAVGQGVIAPVFFANLKPAAPGTFGLGFVDTTAYKGAVTYVDASTAQGFWAVNCRGYQVGSGTFVSLNINSTVVDTGTSLLLLPDSVVTAYYKQVTGAAYDSSQGGYTFPCTAKLPDFTLGIGSSYLATVPGSYMNFAPTGANSKCYGGLQSSSGIGVSVIGLTLIKSQFVVFKGTTSPNASVGFAKKA